MEGLELGSGLPVTDLQPADDLAILAGHAFVSLWTMTKEETYLYNAAVMLEHALTKSRMSFQIRLLLVRIYRLLGRFPYHFDILGCSPMRMQALHLWLWNTTVPLT